MQKLLLAFVFLIFPISIYADVIYLNNGKKVKVERAWIEGDQVKGTQFGGVISFLKSEILKVEREVVSAKIEQKSTDIPPDKSKTSSARELAERAYRYASENPFSTSARQSALETLNSAREIDPNEAEISLTEAIMTLQDGYRIGEWFKASSFNPGYVDGAINKAEIAVKADSKYSKSYAVLAWFHIIKNDYDKAEQLLQTAHDLDNSNFYYWFYIGTLVMEKGNFVKADEYYNLSMQYATTDGLKDLVRTRKRYLAKITGNVTDAERLYLEEIEQFPNRPHAYGNYASFLLCNGQYEKSIEFFTKAINIAPYPAAIQGLERAKQKKGDAANCKK